MADTTAPMTDELPGLVDDTDRGQQESTRQLNGASIHALSVEDGAGSATDANQDEVAPADEAGGQAPADRPTRARRSSSANRRAGRMSGPKRYTIDLDAPMWLWLKHESLESGRNSSELIRAMLQMLMADDDLLDKVYDRVENGEGVLQSAKNRTAPTTD